MEERLDVLRKALGALMLGDLPPDLIEAACELLAHLGVHAITWAHVIPFGSQLAAVKEIRAVTGMSLKEAKAMTEGHVQPIKAGCYEDLRQRLNKFSAKLVKVVK